MKKFKIILFIFVFLLNYCGYSVCADDNIKVALNGQYLSFDVPPQIIDGRTMVPIRTIFEAMGATVSWNDATKTATCTKDNTTVEMTANSPIVTINSQATTMDISPMIIDGRTLAPARYVAESFGGSVFWHQSTQTAIIISNPNVGGMLIDTGDRAADIFFPRSANLVTRYPYGFDDIAYTTNISNFEINNALITESGSIYIEYTITGIVNGYDYLSLSAKCSDANGYVIGTVSMYDRVTDKEPFKISNSIYLPKNTSVLELITN